MAMLAVLPDSPAGAEPALVAVVLASTAPGYAMGQVLADARIDVPDGASTTFLLPSGQTVTVKGPYAGAIAGGRAAGRGGWGRLLVPGQDSSEIGGTRSLGQEATRRLALDPAVGGVFCIAPDTEVVLTRPADPAFDRVELQDTASGRTARLGWQAAEAVLGWPETIPLAAGALRVTSIRTGAERRLELRPVAAGGRSDTARAAALAFAGCARQAEDALDRLRDAIVPLDIYLTSARGRYPVYRKGDFVELTVQTNRDAFVYCLVRDARGRVVPLFPPRPDLARIRGHEPLTLPGPWLPLALRADEALKDGEIRCIAAERNLAAELPDLAAVAGGTPLSEAAIAALDEAAADPRQGRMVMTQLIIRVES